MWSKSQVLHDPEQPNTLPISLIIRFMHITVQSQLLLHLLLSLYWPLKHPTNNRELKLLLYKFINITGECFTRGYERNNKDA